MADFSEIIRWFKDLATLIDTKPVFRWGIITNADPLLVQLDGDDRPLAGSPSTIIGGLAAGERVLCLVQNRRVTVTGRGGSDKIDSLSYTSPFADYGSTPTEISKSGSMVDLSGAATCSTAGHITGNTERTMFTLDNKYRPSNDARTFVCQGSGTEKWILTVRSNGNVAASRYTGSQSAGVWLPFSVSYRAAEG